MVAPAVGPVEARLLVLEDVAGHSCPVVAAEGDLGDVGADGIVLEERSVAFRAGPVSADGDDPIALDLEDDELVVLLHRKLSRRARRVTGDLPLVGDGERLAAR